MIVNPILSRRWFERDIQTLLDNPVKYRPTGKQLVNYEYPILIVDMQWDYLQQDIRLCIQADDYNYAPMRGWWVDEAGAPLLAGSQRVPNQHGFAANPNPYNEAKSWFCFRGWREFHDHPSHQNVPWASIRHLPEYRALALIAQLHSDLNRVGSAA